MPTAFQHFRGSEKLPDSLKGGTIIPGNFDGWHLGHRQLCKLAQKLNEGEGAPIIILTFEPHPRRFFAPDAPPYRLTSEAQKAAAIAATPEVSALVTLEFNESLASMSAEDFIHKILLGDLAAGKVVVGYDFRFGKGRAGSAETLTAHVPTEVIAAQTDEAGEVISSSHIRALISEGKADEVTHYLGRSYAISGIVESGDRLGKQLGFPTANIALADYLRPLGGVYASRSSVGGKIYDSITNYGFRPTVDGTQERFETYIFDFDKDIYGQEMEVSLLAFLRPEKKFNGADELKAQIAEDCHAAQTALAKA